jgi:ribosomal protein S18 acetylase RimI-like enzyme
MEIVKFDLTIHDIERVTELILKADAEMTYTGGSAGSYSTVKDLILAGNNFLGHENIFICTERGNIHGLFIGYSGKGKGKLETFLTLLLKLRLSELASYLTLTVNLLHGAYTPDIDEDDFYISVIVVDDGQRGKGLGSSLLEKAIEIAKENRCKSVLLDVDVGNWAAQALYGKFGFRIGRRQPAGNPNALPRGMHTMELKLT